MLDIISDLPSSYSELGAGCIYIRKVTDDLFTLVTTDSRKIISKVKLAPTAAFPDKPLRCSELNAILKSRWYNIMDVVVYEGEKQQLGNTSYWRVANEYSLGDYCYSYIGYVWQSLVNNNDTPPPDINVWNDGEYTEGMWTLIPQTDSSEIIKTTYDQISVYEEGRSYQLWEFVLVGKKYVYRSQVSGNIGNNPIDPENRGYWREAPVDIYYRYFPYKRSGNLANPLSGPIPNFTDFRFANSCVYDNLTTDDFDPHAHNAPNVSEIEQEYLNLFGGMNSNLEVSLYDSSPIDYIDLLKNSITVSLINPNTDTYTNKVTLSSVKNYVTTVSGIEGLVDLSVMYTKGGKIYTQSLIFKAFKYTNKNSKIVCEDNEYYSDINNDVEVSYINNIISVVPKTSLITECIINNCFITYGS